MRYFIAKNGQAVVDKQVFSGDDSKADALLAIFQTRHPELTITEMDQASFDVAVIPQQKTQAQKDWDTFKASNPTPMQAILYIAKAVGLE